MTNLLKKLNQYKKSNCCDCILSTKRRQIVTHRGSPTAKILGIGEAPGRQEDERGETFTGKAGQLLDEYANSVGIDTNIDMFLINTVMCRPKAEDYDPKENRAPNPTEIAACFPKIKDIVETLNPKIIVLFGVPSMKTCIPTGPKRIGPAAGKLFSPDMHVFDIDVDIYVMYHPSFALRYPSQRKRQSLNQKQISMVRALKQNA